jgi:methylase of polypeptide subunit release factors
MCKKTYFTDISKEALQVAEKNYDDKIKNKDTDPEFIQSDILNFITDKKLSLE